AGRGRAAAEPYGTGPPAVAGPLARVGQEAGGRGDRPGGAGRGGAAAGGRVLAGHAPAARDRRRAARRPAGAHAGRAVQRPRPRRYPVDPRPAAVAGRRGPGGAGVQPSDERAGGHRRAARRGRQGPGPGRSGGGGADRDRLARPGHRPHHGPRPGDGGAGRGGRRRGRDWRRHRHGVRARRRAGGGAAEQRRGAVLRGDGPPGDAGGGVHGADQGRARVRGGRMSAGFARALRAEWTKFRTVRGWVLGTLAAALLVPLLGVIGASASSASCDKAGVEVACPEPPLGPDGRAVRDEFFFVHRTLDGDGSITVRLASTSGIITYPPPDHDRIVPGLVPWAKAGVIVKDGTEPGSSYAAVMVTGEHGVRMQHDYTGDVAGRPGGAPRWLRLVRAGPLLTGYESADGQEWAEVGTARLPGLPERVEIGLFAASPGDLTVKQSDLGGIIEQARFTETTARFEQVEVEGAASGEWRQTDVGATPGLAPGEIHHPGHA